MRSYSCLYSNRRISFYNVIEGNRRRICNALLNLISRHGFKHHISAGGRPLFDICLPQGCQQRQVLYCQHPTATLELHQVVRPLNTI